MTQPAHPLASNNELYEYLVFLSDKLKKRNSHNLSEAVFSASRYVAGMSTEFLGESRIALRRVLKDESVLAVQEREELSNIVKQIDDAFDRRDEHVTSETIHAR